MSQTASPQQAKENGKQRANPNMLPQLPLAPDLRYHHAHLDKDKVFPPARVKAPSSEKRLKEGDAEGELHIVKLN